MAVYYATTQQRAIGRLLRAVQIRNWIRGGNKAFDVPTLLLSPFLSQSHGGRTLYQDGEQNRKLSRQRNLLNRLIFLYGPQRNPSDPDEFDPRPLDKLYIKEAIIRQCFLPSIASVITISAPQMLLSSSLFALLIGFGIYIGFTWTKDLDIDAGRDDSRNVFITYATTLGVSLAVYSISMLIQERDTRVESEILEDYLKGYVQSHTLLRWGCTHVMEGDVLILLPLNTDSENHERPLARQLPRDGDPGSLDSQANTANIL